VYECAKKESCNSLKLQENFGEVGWGILRHLKGGRVTSEVTTGIHMLFRGSDILLVESLELISSFFGRGSWESQLVGMLMNVCKYADTVCAFDGS